MNLDEAENKKKKSKSKKKNKSKDKSAPSRSREAISRSKSKDDDRTVLKEKVKEIVIFVEEEQKETDLYLDDSIRDENNKMLESSAVL